MSVIIKTVSSPKELNNFVRFANRLYKGHPYYVPCMPDDDLGVFDKEKGELVAAGVTMPSLSDALQKCNGEILPFGWWHLLKNMYLKKPDTVDLLLIGVKPELQNKGVTTLVFLDLFTNFKKLGFKYAETSAELETNTKVQAMWKGFEYEQHKRRRVFGKEI